MKEGGVAKSNLQFAAGRCAYPGRRLLNSMPSCHRNRLTQSGFRSECASSDPAFISQVHSQ